MELVEYIKANGLESLCERLAIKAARHGRYPNLVLLKYDQLNSPMDEPVVQQCRGIILDQADGWRVVCRPYDKFFNYGEPHAAAIDWSTARVYEKLDGSLMTLYFYAGEWHVASSGTPDAGGGVKTGCEGTYADLFWRTFLGCGYALPPPGRCTDSCFMFELMTPDNRIVVPHGEARLVLHGVRSIETFRESGPEAMADCLGWKCADSFPLSSFDDVMAAAAQLDPMRCEGYVVRDGRFNRVKVKSPRYVALAHLKEAMNARRLLEIIRLNESSEFLTYFPEWTEAHRKVQALLNGVCAEIEADYARLRDIAAQKDFAAEALKTRCSAALFSMRSGKASSARDYLSSASMASVDRLFGTALDAVLEGVFLAV
jgi:hypothetical protein